jgi:hypothetical protein
MLTPCIRSIDGLNLQWQHYRTCEQQGAEVAGDIRSIDGNRRKGGKLKKV